MSEIEDGTGSGKSVKVGNKNRLHTHALSATVGSVATQNGDAFNVGSQIVNLTSANESAILYVKNQEDVDISIVTVFVNLGTSTGGSGKGTMTFNLNPTGGDIITNAVDADNFNRKIGDANTVTVDAFRGVEGDSITGGQEIEIPTSGGAIASEYTLPKGSSFALSYAPPTGNTNMNIQIGFLIIKNYPTYTVE